MFTPPTDSLYKFMAIFGLVALIWGASFPSQQEGDYRVKESELRASLPTLAMEAEALDLRHKELRLQQQKELERTANRPEPSKRWLELENQKLQLHVQLLKSSETLAVAQAKVVVLQEQKDKYGLFGRWAIGSGLFLAVLGFLLWYLKIQKHLDVQIKSHPG
jgi:hypothetical protein